MLNRAGPIGDRVLRDPVAAVPVFVLLLAEVERSQLLRMISDIGEDALTLLNASRSISVERAEIWSDSGNAVKDICPAAFDGGYADEQGFRCRCVINPFQCRLE